MTAIEGLLRFGALILLRPDALIGQALIGQALIGQALIGQGLIGQASGEALLAAGIAVAALLVIAVLSAVRTAYVAPSAASSFVAQVRVLLRAADPAAAGHIRSRAPGVSR